MAVVISRLFAQSASLPTVCHVATSGNLTCPRQNCDFVRHDINPSWLRSLHLFLRVRGKLVLRQQNWKGFFADKIALFTATISKSNPDRKNLKAKRVAV